MAEAEVSPHAKWCKETGSADKMIRQARDVARQSLKCLLNQLQAGQFTAEIASKKSLLKEVQGQTDTNNLASNKKTAYVIAAFCLSLKITSRSFLSSPSNQRKLLTTPPTRR